MEPGNGTTDANPVDAARSLSAAELLDRFMTDLDTWVMRDDEPTGCLGVLCLPDLRRFTAHWLPAGEIPPRITPQADPQPVDRYWLDGVTSIASRETLTDPTATEDAQCLSMRAAMAHLDALTAPEIR